MTLSGHNQRNHHGEIVFGQSLLVFGSEMSPTDWRSCFSRDTDYWRAIAARVEAPDGRPCPDVSPKGDRRSMGL